MEFTFSIRGALKESWELFKKHMWFFVALAAVSVALNLLGGGKNVPMIVSLILMVATFLWSIVVTKFSLVAADGKEELFSFNHVKEMLPTLHQALGVIGVAILCGLLTIAGLILLIIPGIWVAFRLSVSTFAYLDKGEGVRKAVRSSWNMTRGSIFWTTVLVGIVAGLLYVVGFVLFGVGILVTYPIAMILMAKFYRALTVHHAGLVPAVQPVEIAEASAQQ